MQIDLAKLMRNPFMITSVAGMSAGLSTCVLIRLVEFFARQPAAPDIYFGFAGGITGIVVVVVALATIRTGSDYTDR